MSEPPNAFLWLNGAVQPAAMAQIDPADRGLTLGDGLFETILVRGGAACHAGLHLARLRRGAAVLGIDVPLTDAGFLAAFGDVLAANGLAEAVLRVTLTRGAGPRGIAPPALSRPTLLMTAAARGPVAKTLRAVICATVRRNEFSPLSGLKSLNYLDNIFARREAAARRADEAILCNTQGYVAETAVANIFMFKNGRWRTPFVADGALPGIFRSRLLSQGVVEEGRITVEELFTADCVCAGNTLGVGAVVMLDGQDLETSPDAAARLERLHAG